MRHPPSTVVITSYGTAHHDAPQDIRPITVDASALHLPDAVSRASQQRGGRDLTVRGFIIRSSAGRLTVGQALERIRQRIGPRRTHRRPRLQPARPVPLGRRRRGTRRPAARGWHPGPGRPPPPQPPGATPRPVTHLRPAARASAGRAGAALPMSALPSS